MVQRGVRFVRTADGASLAWIAIGDGPPLVKAANWLTHLEFDRESPVWRHWLEFFEDHFRFVRYDERGCGMSDWQVGDLSPERWTDDLERVVDAAGLPERMVLLGISQGACAAIGYAARHPDRVSHLILYGAYAAGWRHRADEEGRRRFEAIVELTRFGWGQTNPVYRELFASRFLPDADDSRLAWFTELCRKTTTPEIAARLLEARASVDVRGLLASVRVPTLVLHVDRDEVVPLSSGRELAENIPGAEFVLLEGRNHVMLSDEPAWSRFCDAVLAFTKPATHRSAREHPVFAVLTRREREVLSGVCRGENNAAIAQRLHLAEKTVRNHITHVFRKLGVGSRTEAVVFARDRGYEPARRQ